MKWFYDIIEKEGEIHIFDSVDPTTAIASIYGLPLDDEDKRRARLIAAAPEMFEALQSALKEIKAAYKIIGIDNVERGRGENGVITKIETAIAKAIGEKEAVL